MATNTTTGLAARAELRCCCYWMAYNTTDDCTARPIKVVLLDEWMGHGDAAGWKHDDAAGVEWEHGGFAGGQVDEWGRMEARWSCWMGMDGDTVGWMEVLLVALDGDTEVLLLRFNDKSGG